MNSAYKILSMWSTADQIFLNFKLVPKLCYNFLTQNQLTLDSALK